MVTDPKPLKSLRTFPGKSSVVKPDARRIKNANLFEVDRRMPRIRFEQREILVGKFTDAIRQHPITVPEIGAGKVIQRGVQ